MLVTKNIENFPADKSEIVEGGTIDIWWIRLDGGMILLLGSVLKFSVFSGNFREISSKTIKAHLLMRKSSWKKNKLRIFVTAEAQDNSKQMESALKVYLSQFRVFFVSMK